MTTTRQGVLLVAALVLLAAAALLLVRFRGGGNGQTQTQAYRYNVDRYRYVPPRYLTYTPDWVISVPVPDAAALAVLGPGRLLLGHGGGLTIMEDGAIVSEVKLPRAVTAVTVAAGKRYIALGDRVIVRDDTGNTREWAPFGGPSRLTSISVGGGYGYIADSGQRLVWQCDLSGRVVRRLGPTLPGLEETILLPGGRFDLAVAANGVFLANPGRHRVVHYNHRGRLLGAWGRPGMSVDGFSGCCNPTHLAISQDRVLTAEKGLVRIKIHTYRGLLKAVAAPPAAFPPAVRIIDMALKEDRIYVLTTEGKIRTFIPRKDDKK